MGFFIKYDDGTALDTRTGLMWMVKDFRYIEAREVRSWREALDWVATINQQKYAGYSDWRIPTIEELKAVYNPQKLQKNYRGKPVGYPEAFENKGGSFFWSNKDTEAPENSAWGFSFASGEPRQWDKETKHSNVSVRLVRFGKTK
jgi:hypothetical protein